MFLGGVSSCGKEWRKDTEQQNSCLKSVVSAGLKVGKSLGGRSFIKPSVADLCCSFSRADREPGYSSRALAFQKVPAPLPWHSTAALIRETAEDKCAYKMRVGLYLMLSNLYQKPSSLSSDKLKGAFYHFYTNYLYSG